MTVDFEEIAKRRLYKQSGAGVALTIGLPVYWFQKADPVEGDLMTVFPDDLVYVPPDRQFFHYFSREKSKPVVEKLLKRMEQDPNWVKKRIREFKKATSGIEKVGEKLLEAAEKFSPENTQRSIAIYEQFLEKDRSCWTPSAFVDLFDPFEELVLDFVFRGQQKKIEKKDLSLLLTPEESIFWKEKEELEKIRQTNRSLEDPAVLKQLQEHAKKYWWLQNDYQHVQKLEASDFLKRFEEKTANPFWETLPKERKALIKKYDLDAQTRQRLECIVDMAVLRDYRKKFIQQANYFVIEFFHAVAKKLGIPVGNSDFVVPFAEYTQFLNKDANLLKELELRTKNGVWIISYSGRKPDIETKRAKELLELVEKQLQGGSILYGSVANLGKAIGKAKIVLRQADFGKFEEGDILITGMTRPEFVPLMKKASAIITDEGGITCHAAIASRELNKPCIIGTQTATKTFKDGDLLEVNANHGIVKKL